MPANPPSNTHLQNSYPLWHPFLGMDGRYDLMGLSGIKKESRSVFFIPFKFCWAPFIGVKSDSVIKSPKQSVHPLPLLYQGISIFVSYPQMTICDTYKWFCYSQFSTDHNIYSVFFDTNARPWWCNSVRVEVHQLPCWGIVLLSCFPYPRKKNDNNSLCFPLRRCPLLCREKNRV